ncbi:MAG: glutamine synthetase [Halieaceae bacterium]|nr:glutamine synthetase [Halieaceae bacterium]
MKYADVTELEQFLAANPDTQVLELLMPDISGILRAKRIHRSEFLRLFKGDFLTPRSAPLLGAKGDWYDEIPLSELGGDPDQIILPVTGTLAPVPWYDSPVAQVMVAYTQDSGELDWVDPRQPLSNVLSRFAEDGLAATVATELEFYLLANANDTRPVPLKGNIPGTKLEQEGIQYCMADDLFDCDAFLNDVRIASEMQGVPLTTLHGEFSPGQWEINTLHQEDAILAGTHALLLRRIVKGVARKHGYGATFMAKPFAELAGSGMHIHASIYDSAGSNIFADPEPVEPPRLMPRLRHAVGGLGKLLDESMLCFAPHANSYRRFKAGALAPSGKSWGYDHREVALRIPRSTEHNRRIEHRVAGAEANPYLVLAAVLTGIHHGLTTQLDPGDPIARDADLSQDDTTLPSRVDSAIDLFRQSEVLPGYFGHEFSRIYTGIRQGESNSYHAQVPDLDYAWYLRAL